MTDAQSGIVAPLCVQSTAEAGTETTGAPRAITFPINLNDRWRVSQDDLQWVLEHCVSVKTQRWQDRRFHQQREWLLKSIRELCGEVDKGALEAIRGFPEWHH